MDDFVAVKSSGQPLFVLANVVDDRDMLAHVLFGAVSAGVLGMIRSAEPATAHERFRTVMLALMAGLMRGDVSVPEAPPAPRMQPAPGVQPPSLDASIVVRAVPNLRSQLGEFLALAGVAKDAVWAAPQR